MSRIDRYVGSWVSASGYRLHIRRVRKDRAAVDFLEPRGRPIQRPYMHNAPAVQMPASYDDYYGEFRVDLWDRPHAFSLYLEHEYDYVLDKSRREALVSSLSRPEEDHFLDTYYPLFGALEHFVREPGAEGATANAG